MPFSVSSIRHKEITFCNVEKLFGLGEENCMSNTQLNCLSCLWKPSLKPIWLKEQVLSNRLHTKVRRIQLSWVTWNWWFDKKVKIIINLYEVFLVAVYGNYKKWPLWWAFPDKNRLSLSCITFDKNYRIYTMSFLTSGKKNIKLNYWELVL